MSPVHSELRLITAYFRANLKAALEYRASFASEALSMLVNDVMWLVFWVAFFQRFPAVAGWGRAEVVSLWAIIGAAYGVANTLFGNGTRLATLVARGELDFFLGLPRPVLTHALVSRMSLMAWGDVVFGAAAFGLLADPGPLEWLLFGLLSIGSAAILLGFTVLVGSAAFWLADAEGLAQQALNALISFSTYPSTIFRGSARLLLYTVLPAAFLGFVPVEILRTHRLELLAAHLLAALVFVAAGALAFRRGLRRYESGNLFVTRS